MPDASLDFAKGSNDSLSTVFYILVSKSEHSKVKEVGAGIP